MNDEIYILAIETSCDDTSIAIMRNNLVLSNIVSSQQIHELFGGVVPELASREHDKLIVPVLREALHKSKTSLNQIDVIAYTRGPGLLGSLLVGSSFAKSLSLSLKILSTFSKVFVQSFSFTLWSLMVTCFGDTYSQMLATDFQMQS